MKTICRHNYPADLCGICNPLPKGQDELFRMESSLSPRLRWMKRHFISVIDDGGSLPPNKRFRAMHGMRSVAAGPDEISACVEACKALNIKGWEGMI
jgi:hypothetical protein